MNYLHFYQLNLVIAKLYLFFHLFHVNVLLILKTKFALSFQVSLVMLVTYEQKKNLAYITSYQVGYTIYMYDDANAGTRNEWLNFFLIVNLFHVGHNTKVVNIYLYII